MTKAIGSDPRPHTLQPLRLETGRLALRDLTDADRDPIVRYFAEPQSQASILRSQRNSPAIERFATGAAYINRHFAWRDREHFVFGVTLRSDDTLIGVFTLTDATRGSRKARLGWHYGSSFSGAGYATEAGREALRFLFETIGAERAFGDCLHSNAATIRIFQKLGLLPTANTWPSTWLRGWRYGQMQPAVRYACNRRES
jgi:RimJ/RimL family protein N-acetyltransferase